MKLGDLAAGYEVIDEIQQKNDLELTIAWELDDIVEVLKPHYDKHEKRRGDIIKKYGEQDPNDPVNWKIKDPDTYFKLISELSEEEVTVTYKKVDYDKLKEVTLKGDKVKALRPFVQKK